MMKRRVLSVVALLTGLLFAVVPAEPATAMTTATSISSGGGTTCAVMSDSNAYCWGDNALGQFGNGTTTSSSTPQLVSGGHTWASISVLDDQQNVFATTCGVTTAGAGYCWGANFQGEVGDGTQIQRLTPTAVSGGYTWSTISVGWLDVCGVTTTGVGYCWGSNPDGEVGDGTTSHRYTPTLVSGGHTWSSIVAGRYDACGITTSGSGYCWGDNSFGAGGNGGTTSSSSPVAVSGGYTWATLSTGANTSCGVTTTGAGYCWGGNWTADVGDGTFSERDSPVAVSGGYTWSNILPGQTASCGITTNGTTYCWGTNTVGEVGDGNTTTVSTPAVVSGGLPFGSISVGTGNTGTDNTACGLAKDGIAYCWGYNGSSQIGDGTTTNQNVPTETFVLYEITSNTTASVTITPTFTFTVGNQSSACNGESNFVGGAGTASAVALGNLAAGANVSGGQALSVSGNSGGGFAVYVRGTQATQNLRSAGHNWTDVSGSYASPAVLGAGEQFGYTYHDSTTSSSVTNPSSANFIALTNTNEAVIGSGSSTSGSGCVSYDAQTSASTPAASYTATVIYTAVPTF